MSIWLYKYLTSVRFFYYINCIEDWNIYTFIYFVLLIPMSPISFIPEYLIRIGQISFSPTTITSIVGMLLFSLFIALYTFVRRVQPQHILVHTIDMMVESVMNFYAKVAPNLPYSLIATIVFIFVFIVRNNLIWLLGDFFVIALPESLQHLLHPFFRPASTDIYFNMTLAMMCVVGSIFYGFQVHGFHYIEKYIPYRGFGIVPRVYNFTTAIMKMFDIIIGLFIGLVEALWEVAKVFSLSLRLFWNMLAGMVLLWLVITAAKAIFHIGPFLLPLLVFLFELLVSVIQWFVFSMLVLVYFKLAHEH